MRLSLRQSPQICGCLRVANIAGQIYTLSIWTLGNNLKTRVIKTSGERYNCK